MCSANDKSYDLLAPYYRALVKYSKHIDKEISLLRQIVDEYFPEKSARILDAACGTGDALKSLQDYGYRNIEGLDASANMLIESRKILPDCKFYHTKWENMKQSAVSHQSYDLIFILSMSFGHAKKSKINDIISDFYKMLSPNGILVLDNRSWLEKNNTIIQKDRPVNVYTKIRHLYVNEQNMVIDEKCNYSGDKQIVTYRVRASETSDVSILEIPVSYEINLSKNILDIYSELGFSKRLLKNYDNWPYELLIAEKICTPVIALVCDIDEQSSLFSHDKLDAAPSNLALSVEINELCRALTQLGCSYEIINGAAELIDCVNNKKKIDLIFNKSGGFTGLERKIIVPALCKLYKLPFLGSSAYPMTLARHKYHTNRLLSGMGFNVPFAHLHHKGQILPSIASYPVIVKLNAESESLGIAENSICQNKQEMIDVIDYLLKEFNQATIIEEYIAGEEWKIAVIGNDSNITACGCVNTLKNNRPMNNSLQTRSDIINSTLTYPLVPDCKLKFEALETSKKIHASLELNDYSRVDFRISSDNKLYCMEVSTHPDLSKKSSFISAAKIQHHNYSDIIKAIVQTGVNRYQLSNMRLK